MGCIIIHPYYHIMFHTWDFKNSDQYEPCLVDSLTDVTVHQIACGLVGVEEMMGA